MNTNTNTNTTSHTGNRDMLAALCRAEFDELVAEGKIKPDDYDILTPDPKVTLKNIAFSDDPEAFVAKLEGEERLAAEHVLRSFTIAELRKVSSF